MWSRVAIEAAGRVKKVQGERPLYSSVPTLAFGELSQAPRRSAAVGGPSAPRATFCGHQACRPCRQTFVPHFATARQWSSNT